MKSYTKSELARAAGVSVDTFRRWLKTDREFLRANNVQPKTKYLPPVVVKYLCEKYCIDMWFHAVDDSWYSLERARMFLSRICSNDWHCRTICAQVIDVVFPKKHSYLSGLVWLSAALCGLIQHFPVRAPENVVSLYSILMRNEIHPVINP